MAEPVCLPEAAVLIFASALGLRDDNHRFARWILFTLELRELAPIARHGRVALIWWAAMYHGAIWTRSRESVTAGRAGYANKDYQNRFSRFHFQYLE